MSRFLRHACLLVRHSCGVVGIADNRLAENGFEPCAGGYIAACEAVEVVAVAREVVVAARNARRLHGSACGY